MSEATVFAVRTDAVRRLDPSPLERAMPERAARAARFRFEKDRLLCLGAGFLMMEALGVRNEAMIRYGACGRPYVPGGPAFSLSHSGAWCILAAAGEKGREIGADLEVIDERHLDVAPAVYTPAELRWMREDPADRFFRLWTWKESVMKATGLGMNLEPGTFDVLPFADGKAARVRDRLWYGTGGRWDDCMFGLCMDGPVGEVRWIEFSP